MQSLTSLDQSNVAQEALVKRFFSMRSRSLVSNPVWYLFLPKNAVRASFARRRHETKIQLADGARNRTDVVPIVATNSSHGQRKSECTSASYQNDGLQPLRGGLAPHLADPGQVVIVHLQPSILLVEHQGLLALLFFRCLMCSTLRHHWLVEAGSSVSRLAGKYTGGGGCCNAFVAVWTAFKNSPHGKLNTRFAGRGAIQDTRG